MKLTKDHTRIAANEPRAYLDIGHKNPDATLWATPGKFETAPAGDQSHMDIWGQAVYDVWRGRYDPATNQVSALAETDDPLPTRLVSQLRREFGQNVEIWQFLISGPAVKIP